MFVACFYGTVCACVCYVLCICTLYGVPFFTSDARVYKVLSGSVKLTAFDETVNKN